MAYRFSHFAIRRAAWRQQSVSCDSLLGLKNQNKPCGLTRRADAQPLAGKEQLQHVDEFTREEVGDGIIDSSEVPVGISATCQDVVFTGIVENVGLRFQ